MSKFLDKVRSLDWWVIASLLAFIAAGAIAVIDIMDGQDNSLMFRNMAAWLNTAAIVFALFSLRDSLFSLRGEQMRRAYDPDLRGK